MQLPKCFLQCLPLKNSIRLWRGFFWFLHNSHSAAFHGSINFFYLFFWIYHVSQIVWTKAAPFRWCVIKLCHVFSSIQAKQKSIEFEKNDVFVFGNRFPAEFFYIKIRIACKLSAPIVIMLNRCSIIEFDFSFCWHDEIKIIIMQDNTICLLI